MATNPVTKILFVGDLHLGRRPGGLPAHLADAGQTAPEDLSPRAAWWRTVDAAISHRVDVVALAGDLVDRDDDVFEAKAILEESVGKLTGAGITVCAVAGNHDTRVLPELADLIDDLHLLGRGGTWSTQTVTGDGSAVRLVGWSFPAAHHESSPLVTAPPAAEPGLITFGLLHGDLDVPRSLYAPVKAQDLQATGYERWFLGHIHKPDEPPRDGRPAYLGSLTGLDAGETGGHGPVLVTVDKNGQIDSRRLLLAPLRWEHHIVPVSDLADELAGPEADTTLRFHILQHVTHLADQLGAELTETRAVGLRLQLTGALTEPRLLDHALDRIDLADLVTSHGGTLLFVERLTSEVTVRVDLLDLARRNDPPGLLARQLLLLDRRDDLTDDDLPWTSDPDGDTHALLEQARRRVEELDRDAVFQKLDHDADVSGNDRADGLTDTDIARLLWRAGQRSLGVLLAQSGGDDATG